MRELPDPPSNSRRGACFLRLFIPVVYVASAVGVVYGIISYMKAHEPPPRAPATTFPNGRDPSSTVREIQPEDHLPLAPLEPDESAPVYPPPIDPAPQVDPSSSPDTKPSPAAASLKVLEDFLNASTLAERLPHLEGRTPTEELEKSCLAKALPERLSVQPLMASRGSDVIEINNPVENFTNFVFKVTFAKPGGNKESYDILVRQRGTQPPKVVTDPFLDLFGGRLHKFATEPGEGKQGTFQVLVSAYKTCNDTSIPNYEKKISLKLGGADVGKEITTAYAGKASVIGEMLDNDQSGLGWGRSKTCTILLNWNTKDDPARPYLEAIAIKSLNWNP